MLALKHLVCHYFPISIHVCELPGTQSFFSVKCLERTKKNLQNIVNVSKAVLEWLGTGNNGFCFGCYGYTT